MLLNILNLPHDVRIGRLRQLISDTCSIDNVILDNLITHGNGKRITVGLVDNVQASLVMAKLNGYFFDGRQLRVEHIQKQPQQQHASKNSYYEAQPPMAQTMAYQSSPVMYPPPQQQTQNPYNMLPYYLASVQTPYGNDSLMPVQYADYGKQNSNTWGYQSQAYQQGANSRASANQSQSTIGDKNRGNQTNTQNQGFVTYDSGYYGSSDVGKRDDKDGRDERSRYGLSSNYGTEQRRNQRYESPNRSRSPSGRGRYDQGGDRDSGRYGNRDNDRYGIRDSDRYHSRDGGDSHDRGHSDRYGDRNDRERDDSINYERGYDNSRDRSRFEDRGSDRFSGNKPIKPFGNNPAMDYGAKHESRTFYNKTNFQQNKGPQRPSGGPNFQQNKGPQRPSGGPNFQQNKGPRPSFDKPRGGPNFQLNKGLQRPNFEKIRGGPNSQQNKGSQPGGSDTIQNRNELRTITFVSSQAVVDNILSKIPQRPPSPMFRRLKSQVINRVKDIVQKTKCNNVPKIQELYRQQFPESDDAILLESVKDTSIATPQQAGNKGPKNRKRTRPQKAPGAPPVQQPGPAPGRIPKYPNQDKKAFQALKREKKEEAQPDYEPPVEEKYSAAVDEELEALRKVFEDACPPTADNVVEKIRKDIVSKGVEKFLKVVKIQLAKRLSGNFLGLIRIYFYHKPPPRASLDAFLKDYGVVGLKKSDKGKFYVATCNDADGYDKLVALARTEIDNMSITLKPFQLSGKQLKNKPEKKGKGPKSAPINVPDDFSYDVDSKGDFSEEPQNGQQPASEELATNANISLDEKITDSAVTAVIDDGDLEDF